jgi:hypothetical protein
VTPSARRTTRWVPKYSCHTASTAGDVAEHVLKMELRGA